MNGCQEKPKSRPLLARAFGSKKVAASPGAQLLTTEGDVYQHCFVAVPLKTTNEVDLIKPLTKFFEASSSTVCVKVADLRGAIEAFNRLRSNACSKQIRDNQLLLASIAEYYDQLAAFESKLATLSCPRLEGFRWKDAFESGKSFLGKSHTMEADISLEKTAILFNYGAVLSQIAASQPLHTDEERKTSAKLFQQSAGIFAHLKEVIQQTSLKQCTTDLQPDTLALLSNLMLAQAQESVYTKAYGDKMNPNALVKIAAQTGDFYTEVNKALGFDTAKAPWKKEWLNITAGKAYGYQAIAQLHQAQTAILIPCAKELNLQHQEVGERLTRLKHATEQLQAMKRHLPPGCLREQATEIETTYAAALKENKLIYHALEVDFHKLPPLPRAALVKPMPPSSPLCSGFKDLFSSVVPMNILVAVQNYDTMKNERLRMEADKLNEQTELMEGIVASLGVSDEASSALPESVKRHSSEVKKSGGIKELQNKINEMSSLRARNKEILADIEETLNKEKLSDAELRRQLGAKCKRISSAELVGPFLQEVSNYREALHSTSAEDKTFKKMFEENRRPIEMLTKSEKELRLLMPARAHRAAEKNPEATSFLLKMLDKAQEIKCERVEILKEIHAKRGTTSVDEILPTLSHSKQLSHDEMLKEKLNELCETVKDDVDKSLKKQKLLMKDVEKWSNRFSSVPHSKSPVERAHVVKSLSHGYDVFQELNRKLPGRIRHYHNLMENLLRLQQKVNDFSFARETEKEELLRTHQGPVSWPGSGTPALIPTQLSATQLSYVPSLTATEAFLHASSAIASAPLLPAQPTPQFNATVPGNPYQPYAPYGVPPPQLQMQLPQYSQLAASPPPAPPPYHQTYPPHQGAPSPWHGMGYQH
ncbi:hypothetical protein Y032_0018g3576 [Ancylostoma ceylanicum]|uniref:BRO1 domain-containing protein n=1 Tax=Ancylostoma ceylanicum TaxID=53326 RepID=A0A016V324_9BILA|nr:hypothetical protein Y032_0018g3576 [Ancylostoma ceylanicum]